MVKTDTYMEKRDMMVHGKKTTVLTPVWHRARSVRRTHDVFYSAPAKLPLSYTDA